MVYAHSGTDLELFLAKQISKADSVVEACLHRMQTLSANFIGHDTLLYSCLDWNAFLTVYENDRELLFAQELASRAKESGLRRIIVLSYPASYINSDNKYLAQRANIEKVFQRSGVQTIVFKVQAIYSIQLAKSSLCNLFLKKFSNRVEIPRKSNVMVYSISIENIIQSIFKAENYERSASFDLFDNVQSLERFFCMHHTSKSLRSVSPTLLKIKSSIGFSPSLTLLDLFLRPLVPMHNLRTSKELGIELLPTIPSHSDQRHLSVCAMLSASPLTI